MWSFQLHPQHSCFTNHNKIKSLPLGCQHERWLVNAIVVRNNRQCGRRQSAWRIDWFKNGLRIRCLTDTNYSRVHCRLSEPRAVRGRAQGFAVKDVFHKQSGDSLVLPGLWIITYRMTCHPHEIGKGQKILQELSPPSDVERLWESDVTLMHKCASMLS